MSHKTRFGSEATSELEDAVRWYEQRHVGLGLEFLAAVDNAVESIHRWPLTGTPVDSANTVDIRRIAISRFPYHLAYIITGEQVHVLAVAHDRRRPTYWHNRAAL